MWLDIQIGLAGIGQGAALAIMALGLVVIYSGSGVVNFGQGAIATFTAYLFLWLVNEQSWPVAVAFIAGLVVSAAIGGAFHLLIMKPLKGSPPLAKVIPTLGLFVALSAAVYLLFGLNAPKRVSFLPGGNITTSLGGHELRLGWDRIALFVIAVGVTAVLALVFRHTRYGLLTRALGDSELALEIGSVSPQKIASYNWALGGALAGAAGMLASSIAPLTPQFYTTLMVTAVAAALMASFKSFLITLVAAVFIGVAQPVLTLHASDFNRWTTLSGWTDALPLLLIIGVFFLGGKGLPVRDMTVVQSLPAAPRPNRILLPTTIGLALSALWVSQVSLTWVRATSMSAINIVLALSVVVVVGYLGQISLAQMAFAGSGAFFGAWLSTEAGAPFPVAVLIGGLIAVPLGIVFGIPALRVRGMNLAIVTLALAIAIQNLVFQDRRVSGGDMGRATESPTVFGLDVDPFAYPRRWAFVTVVFAALACVAVAHLRRSSLGMTFLATRGNERGAAAGGISLTLSKLTGFVLGAFMAGCAGALMAFNSGQIGPASFAPLASILLVAYAYLGGIGSIPGAIIAGLSMPLGVISAVIGIHNDVINLIAGLGIMQVVVFHPAGLAGVPDQIRAHRRAKRAAEQTWTAEQSSTHDALGTPGSLVEEVV